MYLKNPPRMGSRGFSMMELVTAMAIMGLIVLIAVPKLLEGVHRAQRRSASNRFVSAHSLTRATAIRYGRRAELHIDVTNGEFWIEVDTTGLGGIPPRVAPVERLGQSISIASDRALLCFDARGVPTTSGACEAPNATVLITAPEHVDTLKISILGQIL